MCRFLLVVICNTVNTDYVTCMQTLPGAQLLYKVSGCLRWKSLRTSSPPLTATAQRAARLASGTTRGHPRASLALLVLLKRRHPRDFVVFKENKQMFHRWLSTENCPRSGQGPGPGKHWAGRGEESRASLTLSGFKDTGRCPHPVQQTVEPGGTGAG